MNIGHQMKNKIILFHLINLRAFKDVYLNVIIAVTVTPWSIVLVDNALKKQENVISMFYCCK